MTQVVSEFIKTHTLFVFAYSFFSPHLTSYLCVGILPVTIRDEFIKLMRDNKTHHNCGTVKNGHDYVTTENGLYIFIDHETFESIYNNQGISWFTNNLKHTSSYKIMYPETSLQLVSSGKLPKLTNIMDVVKVTSKEEIDNNLKNFAENLLKEKQSRERHTKAFNDFIAYVIAINPEAQSYAEKIWNFDWDYSYSDDGSVYRRGVAGEDSLKNMATLLGMDHKAVLVKYRELTGSLTTND